MQKILSFMRKAIEDYNMIEEGDKIGVALSGGKDSVSLLMGMKALQRFYPKKFELVAISINPGFDFFNKEFKTMSELFTVAKARDFDVIILKENGWINYTKFIHFTS